MRNYIFDSETINQANELNRIMQPAFIEIINQINELNRTVRPVFIETINQANELKKIMQPAFIEIINQTNELNRFIQPAYNQILKGYQNNLPFLNNRFAWIGAIEKFQQTVSNLALTTDMIADKFALGIATEEILPLFKELDEKVVADIISNKEDIDVPVQQWNLMEKLLKHENTIAWIQGLIMASCDLSISAPICFVISLLLDYFKNKHKS